MRIKGVPPKHEASPRVIDLGMQRIVESRINKGMITTIDSADIDPGALQLAKNVVIRFDKTQRRPGSILLTPTKPNSLPVIKLAFIKKKDGSPHTLRMTPSTIHQRGDQQWYSIQIPVPLVGTTQDRFNTADVLDTFVFTNNGANPIQSIDFDTGVCAPLGNAFAVHGANPRFVFGFFNRVVGLALRDKEESTAIWSADGVPTEFNPAVNNSAGFSPILESPADLSDFITGGLAFTNLAIVFREKSLWHATKQPIAQNPFYFYSAVPGVGCNCPYSIQIVGKGTMAWVDQRTQAVWMYQPGSDPEEIDLPIRKDLFKSIDDPKDLFGAYDALTHEYTVYAPSGGLVKAWTFNRITNAWAFNEYQNLMSANDTELTTPGLTIDELTGTIDDLVGTIDSLSKQESEIAARSYGYANGDIAVEDDTSELDDAIIPFDSVIQSKTFVLPELDEYVSKILVEYQCTRQGQIIIDYTKNNGQTWINAKTITTSIFGKPQLLLVRRLIKARRFTWRLTISKGDISLLSYEIYVTPSGDANK